MKVIVAALVVAAIGAAHAQTYPDRPIKLVVPSPPGGGTDTLSRIVATKLGESKHWQVVVDNRPGAGGNLGMDIAAKSAPDGYTLVMGESSNLTINPSLYPTLPFDPAKDLVPIVLVGTVPLVLVVSPNSPYRNVADVVAAAKAKPLSVASSGNGTVGHLVAESWKRAANIELLHVPYKGAGPALTDLMGGQVDLHFGSLPATLALVQSGKLRPLAVTSATRGPQLPDVPTMAEAGFPGFDANVIYGLLAPAGTSPKIVTEINGDVNRALRSQDMRESLAKQGAIPRGGSPEEFATFLTAERAKWAPIVKASGAKVD